MTCATAELHTNLCGFRTFSITLSPVFGASSPMSSNNPAENSNGAGDSSRDETSEASSSAAQSVAQANGARTATIENPAAPVRSP